MFSEADAKRVSNWTMPFGKYKGMKFGEIDDPEYFEWLVKKTELFNDNPKYKHNKMIREYLEHIVDCVPVSDTSNQFFSLSDDEEEEEEVREFPFSLSDKNDYKVPFACTILVYNGDILLECGDKLWEMTDKYDHTAVCKHREMGEFA